jgi:excisionase family DNA binding protein
MRAKLYHSSPGIQPRLLNRFEASQYLGSTVTWVETLVREGTIPEVVQGKRHLIDRLDLDAYIDRVKGERAAL